MSVQPAEDPFAVPPGYRGGYCPTDGIYFRADCLTCPPAPLAMYAQARYWDLTGGAACRGEHRPLPSGICWECFRPVALGIRRVPVRMMQEGERFHADDDDLALEDFDVQVCADEASTVLEIDYHYADLVRVRSKGPDGEEGWSPYGDPNTTVLRITEAPALDME